MKNSIIRTIGPANIAFIKYWGQRESKEVLPNNDSFSMNLSECYTAIECEVVPDPSVQELFIKDYKESRFIKSTGTALEKTIHFYNRVRRRLSSNESFGFRIRSANSFPKKSGIASSASFFSALTLAFTTAFGAELSEAELSIIARLSGSGSACRSIPDGFCWWHQGADGETSYAESIAPVSYWKLADIVLLTTYGEKKTGSDGGHVNAGTSNLYPSRIAELPKRTADIRAAFENRDFTKFGALTEEDAISMHAVMMTQQPPLYYWSGKTVELIKKTIALRASGIEAYFTIDAGENMHIICLQKDEEKIADYFKKQPEVLDLIINHPAAGARVL